MGSLLAVMRAVAAARSGQLLEVAPGAPSREGTPWLLVLQTLVAYRLIDPGSEWRLHRHWFDASAMGDLLNADFALAEKNTLYRCLDKLIEHKDELFKFLVPRWGELFGAKFDVLLYDLSRTYFESDVERAPSDRERPAIPPCFSAIGA